MVVGTLEYRCFNWFVRIAVCSPTHIYVLIFTEGIKEEQKSASSAK